MFWKRNKADNTLAVKLSKSAFILADCASTADTIEDWYFYMDQAVVQCNKVMRLQRKKEVFSIKVLFSNNSPMLEMPHFKYALDKYYSLEL